MSSPTEPPQPSPPWYVTAVGGVLGLLVMGFFAGLGGLVLVLAFKLFTDFKLETLRCDRRIPPAGQCQITSSNILTSKRVDVPLNQVKKAEAPTWIRTIGVKPKRRTAHFCRVNLVTVNARIQTFDYSEDCKNREQKAKKINRFIAQPEISSIQLSGNGVWIAYIGGGIATLIGAGLILLALAGVFSIISGATAALLKLMVGKRDRN